MSAHTLLSVSAHFRLTATTQWGLIGVPATKDTLMLTQATLEPTVQVCVCMCVCRHKYICNKLKGESLNLPSALLCSEGILLMWKSHCSCSKSSASFHTMENFCP